MKILVLLAACLAGLRKPLPAASAADLQAQALGEVLSLADVPPSPCYRGAGDAGARHAGVQIRYPSALNSLVLGLGAAGEDEIAGEGQRTYRIELENGPAVVSGELRSWVEAETDDVNLVQTEYPQANPHKPGLVAQWVELEACSSRVFTQNVWLVSTMAGVRFRTHATFTWNWGTHTHEIATHAGGVPLNLSASRSGWGARHAPDERGAQSETGDVPAPSAACPEGMTIVTAAVDLMATWEAPQRHWSAYVEGVELLLALQCPLVAFVDGPKIPLLQRAMHRRARLIPFDINDIRAAAADAFGASFGERLRQMRTQSWKTRRWNWAKVADSEEYLTLVLLKPLLFARATEGSVGGGSESGEGLYVWMDSVRDCLELLKPPLSLEALHSRLQSEVHSGADTGTGRAGRRDVFATAYAGIGTICANSAQDVDGLPCQLLPGFSIKASFFAASRGAARWLAGQYTKALFRGLDAGYLLTEEYYLAMVVREEPARFALLDRSDNPLFDDDHCLPHSLLMPQDALPRLEIRWPPDGATLSPEEAVVIFDFRPGHTDQCLQHSEETTLFVIGVRELGEHDPSEASGTGQAPAVRSRDDPLLTGTAIQELKVDGLNVALTRACSLHMSLEAGVDHQVQVYRRHFPLSTRSRKVKFSTTTRASPAPWVDPALIVDSRRDILDRIALQQPPLPSRHGGDASYGGGRGACVIVAAGLERLQSGSDVAAACERHGLRVLYYAVSNASTATLHGGALAGQPTVKDGAREWWDWDAPPDGGVRVVSLDGIGMGSDDVTAEVSFWFDSLSAGGLIVGTGGLFDGVFWDTCLGRPMRSHVASGVEMWVQLAGTRVGCSLERAFPSWYSSKI